LGNAAAGLERAALGYDTEFCNGNYPQFRAGLTELESSLNTALKPGSKTENKKSGLSAETFAPVLDEIKAAAEVYDRDRGLELISPYTDNEPDEEINKLLISIVSAFEVFDCEEALSGISKLEEMLYGRESH